MLSSYVVRVLAGSLIALDVQAQVVPHAGMLRYPDVSASEIVFVYAGDLWLVPRSGGVASPLASPSGNEMHPRFSPDGRTIGFCGSYERGLDLYTISTAGGVPTRVTYHPGAEFLCDWTPEGKLLFFTNAFAGRSRQDQMFVVSPTGGLPEKVGVPYGTYGSFSPDGRWLAYTPNETDDATWKRYRGGMATDIWLVDLSAKTSMRATEWEGTDTQPMWRGQTLYYLSDDGPSHRTNIWAFDPISKKRHQVTRFDERDVKWPSIGPGQNGQGEIVFQLGSDLMLVDLVTETSARVDVRIPGARAALRPTSVDASKRLAHWSLSPSGKRALVEARGDVWTVPAKDGAPRNVTRSSGAFERDPAWSPDGKWIAYFSDAMGEYELFVAAADGREPPRRVTTDGDVFRGRPTWSPDSRSVTFTDKTGSLFVRPIEGGSTSLVDRDLWEGDLLAEPPSFSHDSRWIAYRKLDERDSLPSIWIYEMESGARHKVTSGMFADATPVFDRRGDWLYFASSRHFAPLYGELDTSFVYAGTQQLVAVPLRADVRSPFAAKSDEEMPEQPDAEDSKKDDDDEDDEDEPREVVTILFDGFERRAIALPIDPGLFDALAVNDEGALVYLRASERGEDDENGDLCHFDPQADDPEEKKVAEDVEGFAMSADGKRVLVERAKGVAIRDAKPSEKDAEDEEDAVSTDGMQVTIDPRLEWRQLFDDAWRLMRDFFYDAKLHGVDWAKVRETYSAMLSDCASRADVAYVLREMISELNVGHAYYSDGGGADDDGEPDVGLLGVDWKLESNAWRIVAIHEGAVWDLDARNPVRSAGIAIGDYVLAVNGMRLDPTRAPWAGFAGCAERAITLTVSQKPMIDTDARDVVVEALRDEEDLRFRAWIEKNRAYVDAQSGGKIGYLYVMSTGLDGQNDLVRQFYGQTKKEALLIDERWNDGGQIPTRFIELLNRPLVNVWARRDGRDWLWPPDAHFGPKCMLINGMSGSGGDAFPAYFRSAGLGKLIGTRTWGGLVGLSGSPELIDGAIVTTPSFGYYETNGTWGIEGHGVDPDITVLDDPAAMLDGADPQLDAGIRHLLDELAAHPFVAPTRPPPPNRSGMGITDDDK